VEGFLRNMLQKNMKKQIEYIDTYPDRALIQFKSADVAEAAMALISSRPRENWNYTVKFKLLQSQPSRWDRESLKERPQVISATNVPKHSTPGEILNALSKFPGRSNIEFVEKQEPSSHYMFFSSEQDMPAAMQWLNQGTVKIKHETPDFEWLSQGLPALKKPSLDPKEEQHEDTAMLVSQPREAIKPSTNVPAEHVQNHVVDLTQSSNVMDEAPDLAPTLLSHLPDFERELQARYFGLRDHSDIARCTTCSEPGHMPERCPARTCVHCKAVDQHLSVLCPTSKKCSRCRERGHRTNQCPSKLAHSQADVLSCDICSGTGHTEEKCSLLWRTFNPSKVPFLQQVKTMTICCYQCGSNRHWGGDCPMRPRTAASLAYNPFCAAEADRYLLPLASGAGTRGDDLSIRGRAAPSSRTAIDLGSSDVDDIDDDPSAFRRRKVQPVTSRRPDIRVSIGNWSGGAEPRGRSVVHDGVYGGGGRGQDDRYPAYDRRSVSPRGYDASHGGGGGGGGSSYRDREYDASYYEQQERVSVRGSGFASASDGLPSAPSSRCGGGGPGQSSRYADFDAPKPTTFRHVPPPKALSGGGGGGGGRARKKKGKSKR